MTNWWDILNVSKDADLRTIKRAYAAKLKTIRQDENPAEFMALREAYNIAKNWDLKQTNDQVPDQTHSVKEAPINPLDNEVTSNLLEKADEIIADWSTRRDVRQWQVLLDQLDDLNIDQHADFEHCFFQILTSWYNECFDPDTGEINNSQAAEYQIGIEVTQLIYGHFGWGQTSFMNHNGSAITTLHFLMSGLPMENRYVALPGQDPTQETLPYLYPVENDPFKPIWVIMMVLMFFGWLLSNLSTESTEYKNSYEQLTSQPQVQKINCLQIADRWGQKNNIQSLLNLDIPSTGKMDVTENIFDTPATNNPLKLAQERQKNYQSTLSSSFGENKKTITLLSQVRDIDSDENLTMLALACGLITDKN